MDNTVNQYIAACKYLSIRSCEQFLLTELDHETAEFYMNLVIEKATTQRESINNSLNQKDMYKDDFGRIATDKISGFTGVITGFSTYITGCDQYLIQPRMKKTDKKFEEARWFDKGRLAISEEEKILNAESVSSDTNGADIPAPVK